MGHTNSALVEPKTDGAPDGLDEARDSPEAAEKLLARVVHDHFEALSGKGGIRVEDSPHLGSLTRTQQEEAMSLSQLLDDLVARHESGDGERAHPSPDAVKEIERFISCLDR